MEMDSHHGGSTAEAQITSLKISTSGDIPVATRMKMWGKENTKEAFRGIKTKVFLFYNAVHTLHTGAIGIQGAV